MDASLAIVALGAALGGFAQGVAGFAFALVALSIWAWGVDPTTAVVLSVFGSLLGQLVTIPFVWRSFDFRRALPFILGGLVGIPIGAQMLGLADPSLFKLALGSFLLIYCPIMLALGPNVRVRHGGRIADAAAGWIGGLLGGLAGISGPIPTLWTTLRGWDKDEQRGVLQGFNIAMHVATLVVYGLDGRITSDMSVPLALTCVALVPFALIGVVIYSRLSSVAFRRLVLVVLTVSGLTLVAGALAS